MRLRRRHAASSVRDLIASWGRTLTSPNEDPSSVLTHNDLIIYLGSFVFFLLQPFGGFDSIIGDNIAQVGYWRILFHRHLVGSLGSTVLKPGLVLVLGFTHDISIVLFHSTVLIKVVIAVFAALLTWVVARIASEVGGVAGGLAAAAYLVARTPLLEMVRAGTSPVFFLPLLIIGIWLFSHQRQKLGAVFLCLAALMRLEGICVLAWLVVFEQVPKRRWKQTALSTVCAVLTMALFVALSLLIQGSFARLSPGNQTGYLYPEVGPTATIRFIKSLAFTIRSCASLALRECQFPCLAVPAIVGLLLHRARRIYLSVGGIVLFMLVYATLGTGPLRSRYFEFVLPGIAAFGTAGLLCAYRLTETSVRGFGGIQRAAWISLLVASAVFLVRGPEAAFISLALLLCALGAGFLENGVFGPQSSLPALFPLVLSVAIVGSSLFHLKSSFGATLPSLEPYTLDADDFLRTRPIPRGASALIEDDMIYGIVIREPDYLNKVVALQYFNIQNDLQRAGALRETDYVLVSKRAYSYYYLSYDPLQRGDRDPFRKAIHDLLSGGPRCTLYGRHLTTLENSPSWLVLKVHD